MSLSAGRLRCGRVTDLAFLVALQKRCTDEVGFLPRAASVELLEAGGVVIGRENGDEAGALLWRPTMRCQPGTASIVQAAVAMDAQRRRLGLEMVGKVCQLVAPVACVVQCWCAADLESNEFWRSAGFELVACREPENRRNRRLNLWRIPLGECSRARLLELPRRAGYRAGLFEGKRLAG